MNVFIVVLWAPCVPTEKMCPKGRTKKCLPLPQQIVPTCNKEDPPQAWSCLPSTRSALSPPQRKDISSEYVDRQFIISVMIDKQFQIKILHLDYFLNLPGLQWPAQGLSVMDTLCWISWKEIASCESQRVWNKGSFMTQVSFGKS